MRVSVETVSETCGSVYVLEEEVCNAVSFIEFPSFTIFGNMLETYQKHTTLNPLSYFTCADDDDDELRDVQYKELLRRLKAEL